MNNDTQKQWFAMRATFNRNMLAKREFDALGITTYVPMRGVRSRKKGSHAIEMEPVVRNLIFVQAQGAELQRVKQTMPYLQYMISRADGSKIVVPEVQMNNFIAVSSTCDERLRYFSPEELNLSRGTRVRITDGDFAGMEGTFMRVTGSRDRRVVISLPGVVSVALVSLPTEWVKEVGN